MAGVEESTGFAGIAGHVISCSVNLEAIQIKHGAIVDFMSEQQRRDDERIVDVERDLEVIGANERVCRHSRGRLRPDRDGRRIGFVTDRSGSLRPAIQSVEVTIRAKCVKCLIPIRREAEIPCIRMIKPLGRGIERDERCRVMRRQSVGRRSLRPRSDT